MSGIYIPGMEMPQRDEVITIFPDGTAHRHHLGLRLHISESKAVPVPEHGRLVDADALKNTVLEALNNAITDGNSTPLGRALCAFIAKNIVDEIEAAPTVIPADKEETLNG